QRHRGKGVRRRRALRGRDRPALLPPVGGRHAARRSEQGESQARLAAEGALPRAGRRDGARGPARGRAQPPGQAARLRRVRSSRMSLARDARIYVAGHRGLAGSAIVRRLRAAGYENLVLRTHAELELTDAAAVRRFFESERPRHVFLAAAKVGGILANDTYPAEFIRENLAIQTNVIHEAWRCGVERLLFLGSSCIYPRECPQPM